MKVTFTKAEDVQRAIEEKVITIGFNEAKYEIFDKYRRRPRQEMLQVKSFRKRLHESESMQVLWKKKPCIRTLPSPKESKKIIEKKEQVKVNQLGVFCNNLKRNILWKF
ncbi:hypothetical protein RFI_38355, partial [Reticulomyxa filosa]